MKKKISKLLIGALTVMICLSFLSCSKMFDIQPKSAVVAEQMYRNVYDADAAVIGVYGKFMGLAKQYVVLNEAQGDLIDITANSDQYLKQLSTHTVTTDNPYADPRPFYSAIINCNDVLKNFNIMLAQHKMSVDQYNQRYSDVGAMRTWLYLQVGIHFGTIPYVTDPIESINDLQNDAKFPKIGFDQLLDNLIQFTESLPYKNPYPSGTSLLSTYDTYYTEKMFINKNVLLGELYLWKGNWTKSATAYRAAVDYALIQFSVNPGQDWYEYYRNAYSVNNGGNWINIFNQPFGERYTNWEIMWNLPFDKNFSPKNPFIDLFTPYGAYLLKPSDLAINNWNSQFRNDNGALKGTPTDVRGLNQSYKMVFTTGGLLPMVNKYNPNYSPTTPFETSGKWILYRAASLWLHFAEAANRDGRDKLALAFINNGVNYSFDPTPGVAGRDVTNIQVSTNPTTGLPDSPPYDFDARNGEIPRYRSDWYRQIGLRSRMGDMQAVIDSTRSFNMTALPRVKTNDANLRNDVEDIIIAEAGLETAFEGNRWADLLRIALRRKATDPLYLANKIGAKFDAAHSSDAAAVKARLANPANWYLPFKWK